MYFCNASYMCATVNQPPVIVQSIHRWTRHKLQHIATECFSSDSLQHTPEQHTKNDEKSIRANIIFFGKIQNGS